MAVSVSTGTNPGRNGPNALGARKTAVLRVTFDSSYPAGGEPIDFRQFVDFTPSLVFVSQRAPLTGAYQFVYDNAAKKLMVFWVDTTVDGAAMAEVVAATNLATLVVDVLLVGD